MLDKYEQLKEILKGYGKVAVAFSGGVDSSFLLKVASDALGDDVIAVTLDTVVCPGTEKVNAADLCKELGVEQLVIPYDVFTTEEFGKNSPDRCYYCKKAMFEVLKSTVEEKGFTTVVEGSNQDDNDDYRPGLKALEEVGIKSPLMEAGLTKADIRELSRRLKLRTWDKPAFACLASRIAYGEEITEEKLYMIESAEEFLLETGLKQMRVRMHGTMARIEVLPAEFDVVMQNKDEIYARLQEIGFSYVSLDLQGYRSGSMNEGLK